MALSINPHNYGEGASLWKIPLNLRKQKMEQFDLIEIFSTNDGSRGSEIEQAVVAVLNPELHQKIPPATNLLIEESINTVQLSMARREDIDLLRETAQGRFVNVR